MPSPYDDLEEVYSQEAAIVLEKWTGLHEITEDDLKQQAQDADGS